MELSVLTPGKELFNGEAESIKVPGSTGEFELLNNHAAIVSSLKEGTIRIKVANGSDITYKIEKGFIEALHNKVSVLIQGVQEA